MCIKIKTQAKSMWDIEKLLFSTYPNRSLCQFLTFTYWKDGSTYYILKPQDQENMKPYNRKWRIYYFGYHIFRIVTLHGLPCISPYQDLHYEPNKVHIQTTSVILHWRLAFKVEESFCHNVLFAYCLWHNFWNIWWYHSLKLCQLRA